MISSRQSAQLFSSGSTADELLFKLEQMRQALHKTGATGLRLRGTDWFSWATGGAIHTVLLAAETGVAEVLVTNEAAWIVTSEIEARRFQDEELAGPLAQAGYKLLVYPWADPTAQKRLIAEATQQGWILSDRPIDSAAGATTEQAEAPLPPGLVQAKRTLMPAELERYRRIGRLASEAMTEVMHQAQPDWSENQLAGAGAAALWARGLHPALTLAAGERRLPLYRHPIPTSEALGRRAMLVFCARGEGLYANLTRFVCFGGLSPAEQEQHQRVQQVETATLNACQIGRSLAQIYDDIAQAYQQVGQPEAIQAHHQGGTTGYLAREVIATPAASEQLVGNQALAWNPSLPGAKIEDTFVLLESNQLENLSFDPNWPSVEVAGRSRPLPLER
jgi:Xaa-Pro aminopeptidase